MLFNSIDYLFFLPIVFAIYWSLNKNLKLQNIFLLSVSYFFYGLWDYRFLSLIVLSSVTDYIIGIQLGKQLPEKNRKIYLGLSLLVNLGFLVVFKYHNFFIDSFIDFASLFGLSVNIHTIKIILPVGISFYTFQTLSYSIDVYRKKLKPTTSVVNFFTYVAFFPQLVAGPIERASNLLPQVESKRVFNLQSGRDGLRQILWGLFKKVVIADNCADIVDNIFTNYQDISSPILIIGAILFGIQIYCDFSGYSDIAIGSARLLGINLKQNFATPYFSRDIAEFWRRWHISLSTWFRDYLYIPLGGSRVGKSLQLRNVLAIFLVSGFWHGANWTFILWGLIHSLFYIPQILTKTNRNYIEVVAKGRLFPSILDLVRIIRTFAIVTVAWIFFRSSSISDGFRYIQRMVTVPESKLMRSLASVEFGINKIILFSSFIFIMFFFEWLNRDYSHGLFKLPKSIIVRFVIYIMLSLMIIEYFYGETSFIYFQF